MITLAQWSKVGSSDDLQIVGWCVTAWNGEAETAGERVYRRLRTDIIFGRLAPSQKLKLERLQEAYGISISTLRELLNRLTSEGLIVAESARGFEVAPVSAEHFKELANLRLLLECHALQRSFALGDMDWEGRVVAAHHKLASMEKRTLAGDLRGHEVLKRYDFRIPSGAVVGLRLAGFAARARGGVRQICPLPDDRRDFPRPCRAGASEIARCALKRDAKAAQAILATHIMDCVAYTLSHAPQGLLTSRRPEIPRHRTAGQATTSGLKAGSGATPPNLLRRSARRSARTAHPPPRPLPGRWHGW